MADVEQQFNETEPSRAVYRAMKQDQSGKPVVARSARALGVRIDGEFRDIPVDKEGKVHPFTGGMSVVVDDPRNLPFRRRPPSLGGDGRDPVFELRTDLVPDALFLHVDHYPHASVEPQATSTLEEYETELSGTKQSWVKANE